MSPGLRFAVLDRDGFTCFYCGATGAGIVLHVDHFIPLSRGGEDDYMNLVAACEACNIGKASIIADIPTSMMLRHIWNRSEERSRVLLKQIPFIVAKYSEDQIASIAGCLPDPFWPRDNSWHDQLYQEFILCRPRPEEP
jgi:hypothetical protein